MSKTYVLVVRVNPPYLPGGDIKMPAPTSDNNYRYDIFPKKFHLVQQANAEVKSNEYFHDKLVSLMEEKDATIYSDTFMYCMHCGSKVLT